MDVFYQEVSVYNGVTDNMGIVMPLGQFLFDNSRKLDILLLRNLTNREERNRLKRLLPQATVSGVFAPTRAKQNLRQHSGLICIDVDAKDNPDIADWEDLKKQLAVLPQVAYCALSASGQGVFAIIPLRYPKKHLQQFRQLQCDFLAMGITIDAACSDITRLRSMTYDAHPIVNRHATPYEGVCIEPMRHVYCIPSYSNHDDVLAEVQKWCEMIKRTGTDITSSYEDWVKVGCALASLGERGRYYFHVCSQQNFGYKEAKTDKLFSDLLRRNYQEVGIGTFFWICKQHGLKV